MYANLPAIMFWLAIPTLITMYLGSFIVQEGNVGVIYYLGSLQKTIYPPGPHFKMPFLTTMHEVQVTVQTDKVKGVVCGTSSGVSVTFDSIEVVNQLDQKSVYQIIHDYGVNYDKTLIYDKINHLLNQFCSKHTLQEVYIDKFDELDDMLIAELQKSLNEFGQGISIRSVRISKPSVPPDVSAGYQGIVTSQARKLMDTTQAQENLAKIKHSNDQKQEQMKAENEQSLMSIEFQKQKELAEEIKVMEVNKAIIQKEIELQQGLQEIAKIKADTEAVKRKAEIDVEHYKNMKEVEYTNALQTDAYVKIKMSEHFANNSKVYAGSSLPDFNALIGIAKGLGL